MAGSPLITTSHNRAVANARRLTKRAFRRTDRRFLVEGPTGVAEAVADAAGLLELFVTPEAAARYAVLVAAAAGAGTVVHSVTPSVLADLAETVTPQGIVGVAALRDITLAELAAAAPRLVVVLAAVRDPGNAGTILRTADAAGADAVVFSAGSVDPYNPKCVRSSAGSVFHVPFVIEAALDSALRDLRGAGMRVLATSGSGAVDLYSTELSGPVAWVLGNEAWGLPEELVVLADESVRVPIHGRAESLNLATAAAVCLYESARAQRAPGGCRGDGR
ncbi:MAG: methyltransferase, TrmH family [Frankiaceae bacterium]|nr:methyltransferase, TrmH family [Frankiaceae bacterium]